MKIKITSVYVDDQEKALVLDHLLGGTPIGRIVGREAMKFGWPRLNSEYAKQFGMETPDRPSQKGRTN
jgi:hypothetical protein